MREEPDAARRPRIMEVTIPHVGPGGPWNPGVVRYPEGAHYNYAGGAHALTVFHTPLPGPHVKAAMQGNWRFALYEDPNALFVLFDNDIWHWAEAPFCWHRLPVTLRATSDQIDLDPADEMSILVSLVDRTTGRLTAWQNFTLPANFSAALHDAIKRQAATVITDAEHDAAIARTFRRFVTADGMAEVATAQCTVNHRGGVR